MTIESPSISRRLLPLLDIVFILLAFFIILPQGVIQKKETNLREKDFASSQKDLSSSRFIYIELKKDYIEVEYMLIKDNHLKKIKQNFALQEFGDKGQIPQDLIEIIKKVRGQIRGCFPGQDIRVVINKSFYANHVSIYFFLNRLVSFSHKNKIPYATGDK